MLAGLLVFAGVTLAVGNPFAASPFYLNPANQRSYDQSIATAPSGVVRQNLKRMRSIASAYWIDKKSKIKGNTTRTVEGILADAASKPTPELVVLIWYDLPNRDCAAAASAGEICCAYNEDRTCNWGAGGDCSEGIAEYKTGYVDPFIEVLEEFKGKVPVVIVFEPDSLPNFATNLDKPHCGLETQRAYIEGAKYALTQLTSKTDASVYIDAAHGGWLGWHNNLVTFLKTLQDLDVSFDKIRGFSTNVAGYQPLGQMCPWEPDSNAEPYRNGYCLNHKHANSECCADPCSLLNQWDSAQNELNYAQELHHAAKGILGMDAHIIIDTGRNGVPDERQDCKHWCNNRGAGAGTASTTQTEGAGIVDAYFYLKTPGESDGCTETLPDGKPCPRFDVGCGSPDAIGSRPEEPRAPEAGAWFDYQVKQLAELADLGEPSAPVPIPHPPTGAAPQPAPQPATTPVPQPPSQDPLLTSPGPAAKCCWGSSCATDNCAATASWCSESAAHCKTCGGLYCAPPALVAVSDANARRKQPRRHRFLALENAMLQKHMHKRAALARKVALDEL